MSKIVASLMSMLKTTVPSQVLIANEVLAVNEIGSIEGDGELIQKCGKLSKTRKLSQSRKSAKSGKKLSKSGNLPNFNTQKNKPSFLTSNLRTVFNYLEFVFTKALIL